MRISRRTSGGRGEYEISEECNGTTPHDLVGRRIYLIPGRGLLVDTATELREQGGKLRLRRIGNAGIQVQRQVAAALLLPHPVRANNSLGGGTPVIRRNQYAIDHLHVAEVDLAADVATLRLDTMIIRNQMFEAEEIPLDGRLATLRNLWGEKERMPEDIARLILDHETYLQSLTPVSSALERVVSALEELVSVQATDLGIPYSEGTDVLDYLSRVLDLVIPEPLSHLGEVDPEEPELRRRVLREWKRWANSRGAPSARFRAAVRRAYNSTCAVCGQHLPATQRNRQPGVDAAHILPWAEYDLDYVFNGICLCKLHHWAFDEGLLRIRMHEGDYMVDVPPDVRDSILSEDPKFSLECLEQHVGPIPSERLPQDPSARPNQSLLQELNDELDMI